MRIRSPVGAGAIIPSVYRHARLLREYPGERLQGPGPLEARLRKRDREVHAFQGVFRGLVTLEPHTERSPRQMVDPSPNAPLLIRVVRFPYAETVSRGRRRQLWDAARPGTQRVEPRPRPVADVRALRDEPPMGNPVKALSIHPAPLAPPPSVDAWLASREA